MKLRLFVAFSLFLSFSHFSYSEVIQRIEFLGLESVDRGTVLNHLPIESSDEFEEKNIQLILENLYKSNLFKKVSLSFNDGVLTINFVENPTIKYIDIVGFKENHALNEKSVENLISNTKMNVGKIFIQKNFESLVSQLKTIYENKGFYSATFNISQKVDDSNRIGIEVNINENSPARITSFEIKGNSFFPSNELINIFDIGLPDIFFINYFSEKDSFNMNSFEAGIQKIKSKYLESGFLDFKVVNRNLTLNDDKTEITISFTIEEGNQYFINDYTWTGDIDGLSKEKLDKTLNIVKGSIFSRKKIVKGISKIRSLFSDIGYAKASVNSSVIPSEKSNYLNLIIDVTKHQKMYVNRILIEGNTITQDDVIRRELKLNEGQEFSQKSLDESVKRIKRLGFFSDVDISISESPDFNDRFNIFIKVSETKTGQFSIGLSHSNATGAAFNTGIEQNNVFGTGNVLNARFTNSTALEELSFFFKDPYFTNDGNSLSYGLFTKSTDASNLDISNYLLDENGFNLGYGIPLSSDSNISSEIKVSDISLSCSDSFAGVNYEQEQCLSNKSLDFNYSISYVKNSLNDFYNPTKGIKNTLSSKLSLPLGDFKYFSTEFSRNGYTPVFADSTIKTTVSSQFATGYGGDTLPFFKRYYGGGSSSVRGFDFNSLGAKYPDDKAKGGEFSLLTSLSLISPAEKFGLDNENIRFSAFIDAGSISEKLSDFDMSQLRLSSGLAASWLTPIGPIGIFWAQPIIKKSTDQIQNFAFELGTTF